MADVEQHTGTVMPLTKEQPALEYGKITADMQVRKFRFCSTGLSLQTHRISRGSASIRIW